MSLSKTKSFDIVMVTPNDVCMKALDYVFKNSVLDHDIYLIDNGATVLGYDLGKYKGLIKLSIPHDTLKIPEIYNQAWKLTKTNYVAFIHNDTIVLEHGWDVKVEKYFNDKTAVLGFSGATGYGNENIYVRPFENADVARIDFRWNFNNKEVREYALECSTGYDDGWLRSHGKNLDDELMVASVVDGLIMIIRREVFERIGGFDERFIFQGFDENLCLHAISLGYDNYMVNIKYFHEGSGGASSYLNLLKAHNMNDEIAVGSLEVKNGVHREACLLLYNNWKELLPIRKLGDTLWQRVRNEEVV